jgi:hypothetical protein
MSADTNRLRSRMSCILERVQFGLRLQVQVPIVCELALQGNALAIPSVELIDQFYVVEDPWGYEALQSHQFSSRFEQP